MSTDVVAIAGAIRKLRSDPASLPLTERLGLADMLRDRLLGESARLPERAVSSLARMLAADPWHEVRAKVSSILHLLDKDVFDELWPALARDDHAVVRNAALRGKIRRWKIDRHQSHVQRVMNHMAKLSANPTAATAVAGAAPVTLEQFMRQHCASIRPEQARQNRRKIIKAASRDGATILLPPHVGPWRRGQAYYFQVADLIRCWPAWITAGLPLPPLKF